MTLPDPVTLDHLADRGWPALEREYLGGWTLRAAGGVTNRANSVLASGPVDDIDASVDAAERWYSTRGLPTVFHVSPASPRALSATLAGRQYREHSHTDILVADRRAVTASGASLARASVAAEPAPGWLDAWWEVDGRGGGDEQAIVARILAGGPALYAWAGEPTAPDAVGRLALADDWGGLYAVATLPAARRRGLAREVVLALAAGAEDHGVSRLWLQVFADNTAAHALYESLGFAPASRYAYWTSGQVPGDGRIPETVVVVDA